MLLNRRFLDLRIRGGERATILERRRTVKTQIIMNKDGLIIHITGHVRGRKHDYDLFRDKHPPGCGDRCRSGISGDRKGFSFSENENSCKEKER